MGARNTKPDSSNDEAPSAPGSPATPSAERGKGVMTARMREEAQNAKFFSVKPPKVEDVTAYRAFEEV